MNAIKARFGVMKQQRFRRCSHLGKATRSVRVNQCHSSVTSFIQSEAEL